MLRLSGLVARAGRVAERLAPLPSRAWTPSGPLHAPAAWPAGGEVLLIEAEPNPSSAYLLRPALARAGCRVRQAAGPETPPHPGDFVVIVRYLTPAWCALLERLRPQLAGLAYLMDDDLFDPRAWAGLPPAYQRRLAARALRHAPWIARHADALWVGSEALAAKYATLQPRVLPLAPNAGLLARTEPVRLFYHGSASHRAEVDWLRPVLARVLDACPDAQFELFGDATVHRAWRELPRVAVRLPMRWPDYLAWTAGARADIGLAPLLPGGFNAGRGAVKFYDHARLGATGVYADAPPYRGLVRDGVDGLLLPLDPDRWAEALIALVRDRPRCHALAAAARARALAEASAADAAAG
ncbi:MAG TPA: glycosyltransferase [Methylibium sp.]|nr:glycosyltransferase [Methylibium sp.]